MDIKQLRVEALRRLMGDLGNKEFAEKYDLDASYISQLLNNHRPMGEKAAQNLERKIGLAPGSLVHPTWAETQEETPIQQNVEPGPHLSGRLPLISWVQAGAWSEVVDLYAVGDAEEWIPCPGPHGPRAFLLRVRGESMKDPHGRISFDDGDLVAVDPDKPAGNKSLVVVKLPDSQEATFKQLIIEGDQKYLKALNPAWPEPIFRLEADAEIVATAFYKMVPM